MDESQHKELLMQLLPDLGLHVVQHVSTTSQTWMQLIPSTPVFKLEDHEVQMGLQFCTLCRGSVIN